MFLRLPAWVVIVMIILGLGAVSQGVAGITFQWSCEEYAQRKAQEIYDDGYARPDTYGFFGFIIGFCTVGYSEDEPINP